MGQDKPQEQRSLSVRRDKAVQSGSQSNDFVLEKSIFNNVFEKDIRRVFIYKKAERLGKAIHLISPAFAEAASLKNRIDSIAIALVDAATLPPRATRTALSRELLALSSILSMARTGGFLSHMNAELISREAQHLLQEVAAYEEPRVELPETPSLSMLSRTTTSQDARREARAAPSAGQSQPKRHAALKDNKGQVGGRRESIISVLKEKGSARIKDISMVIRGVSEKTIQRELGNLIEEGVVRKEGERRWSTYFLT